MSWMDGSQFIFALKAVIQGSGGEGDVGKLPGGYICKVAVEVVVEATCDVDAVVDVGEAAAAS